jgi:hypothetical protein
MRKDPIVEEVRRLREAYAEQFNFDLAALAKDLKKQEAETGRAVVSRKPRTPSGRSPTAA